MAGSNDTTVRFKADISQLKSQMQAAERQIKLVNSEFKAATAGMDDWTKSADGLTAKTKQLTSVLDSQNKKLALMEQELEKTVKVYGENSAAADRVRIKINEQRAAIAKTESQLKTYSDKLSNLSDNMDDAADGSKDFISATDKLKSSISEQESKLESLKKRYSDLVTEGKGLSSEAKETASQISKLSGELQENKSKLESAESAADEFDQSLNDMDDAAQKAGDGFTVMKGALANLVADGIRATIDAVKDLAKETFTVGSNFESAMSQVAAVSGAGAEDMEALTAKAEEMGAKTKFSATESAEAFNYMAMAGWKTEDMLNGIEGIMNLAAASGSDLATASDIVTDALTAMGYSASDAGRLADVMAAASSNANTNVEMMGATFQYAAPIVGALGYSMEDTAVAIGLMANAGIKGDKAGTALRSTLTRLSAPPKECATAMEELGITLTDEQGNMKDLSTIMDDLRKAFANLDETQQTANAKAIAGQEAMSGLLAIVNAAPEDYDKLTLAVQNSTGAAQDMANTMQDNVGGQITLLKSKIEGIMIKLFNSASDSMRDGITSVSDALDKVDWDKAGNAVGTFAKKAVDLFAYIINNGDRIISIIKTTGLALGTIFVSNKIATTGTAIVGFVSALTKAKSATEALSLVTTTLGINMAALPIMAIVAALAAVVAIEKKHQEQVEAEAQATYGLTEEQKKLCDAIDESADALQRANDARKDSGTSIDSEYGKIQDLKDQYNSLIDENGKVIDGSEDLAETLLGELANGLGTTIDNIKENIDANGKLGDSIDELIEKKKNEAKINAFESDYQEAVKNQVQNAKDLAQAKDDVATADAKLTEAQNNYNAALDAWNTNMDGFKKAALATELEDQKQALNVAQQSYDEMNAKLQSAQSTYDTTRSIIINYNDAIQESYKNNETAVSESLLKMQYSLLDYNHASKEALEQQYIDSMTELDKIEQLYASGDISADVVTEYQKINQLAGAELDKWVAKNGQAGTNSVNNFSTSASAALQSAYDAAKQLGNGSTNALNNSLGDWGNIADEKTGDYLGILSSKTSEAQEKGSSIGQASADGAKSKVSEFEAAAEESANKYTNTIDSFSSEFSASGKLAADTTATGAADEAGAMANPAESAVTSYAQTIESMKSQAKAAGESLASEANNGAASKSADAETSGSYFGEGFFNGIGSWLSSVFEQGKKLAQNAWNGLKEGQQEGSPSKLTTQSGKYFGEGYTNGIKNTTKQVILAAANMASGAVQAVRDAQQEGSPSKLTYQSGRYFTQGFINGIASLETSLVNKTKSMVSTVLAQLLKLENFNFSEVTSTASSALSTALAKQTEYMSNWLQYNSQQMLSDFDDTIDSLQSASDSAVDSATAKSEKKQAAIQKKIDKITKIAENKRTKKQKAQLKKLQKQLEKEQKAVAKNTENIQSQYQSQIEEQQAMKEAYQQASSSMMSQFTSAMNEYATAAQKLVDDTMNGISNTYQSQYDALVNKQDSLIEKLKSAGDLFNISSANVMTINDIKAQTAAIKQYADKLKEIKEKVSGDLFDEIASYDMQQGEAFIDRLLAMSDEELKAYSEAYDEKMSLAESLSESIYQSDFDAVADEYEKAMEQAFKDLPSQLETLGYQTMQGFLQGLTTNTDYMSDAIKTFVSGMIDQFKDQLGIHSPSKVAAELGAFTGKGFANGLADMVNTVKKAAQEITDTVASNLDWQGDISGARGTLQTSVNNAGLNSNAGTFGGTTTQIINFNQTNNSPKALDRLTLYRQTNNMLFSAKVRLSDV